MRVLLKTKIFFSKKIFNRLFTIKIFYIFNPDIISIISKILLLLKRKKFFIGKIR